MEKSKSISEHNLKEVIYQPLSQNIQHENEKREAANYFLYFAAFAVNLSVLGGGCSMVWPSPAIPRLQLNDTELNPLGRPVTPLEISMIAGLTPLGGILGPLFFGKVVDICGGRWTMACLSTIMLISYVVLAFARKIWLYFMSRLLTGIAFSLVMQVTPIFISEITEDHNRGKFGCFMAAFLQLGCLYAFVVGTKFSIKIFTLLCGAPLVLSIVLLSLFVPDSPFYLVSKGNKDGAIHALKKYRNKSHGEIEKDLEKIDYILKQTSKSNKVGFISLFKTRSLRKGLIVALGINLITYLSGITTILGFIGPVFDQAGTGLSGDVTAILTGVVQIIIFTVTSMVIEKIGRRPLLLFSSLFSGIPLFLLGLYFYLKDAGSEYINNILWLPVFSIIACIITYSMGIGPIPMAIMGEMFPNDMKSIAVSFILVIVCIIVFVLNSGFPIVAHYLGLPWVFWLFSAMCFLGFAFIYFVLPETKGKSILEIQEILNK